MFFKFRNFLMCIGLAFIICVILRISELVSQINLLTESIAETCTKQDVYAICKELMYQKAKS